MVYDPVKRREDYLKNRDRDISQAKGAYKKNKQPTIRRAIEKQKICSTWVNIYKRSKGCRFCGLLEPICLDFHHIIPKDKEKCVSTLVHSGNLDKVKEEIKKCIVICSNCHRMLHSGLITYK